MSCTASKHLSTSTKPKPSLNENSEDVWYAYWEDQLDANGGYVPAPFSSEYPQGAVDGYNRAKIEWDAKVQQAKIGTACIWGSVGIGLLILSTMILINDTQDKLDDGYYYY